MYIFYIYVFTPQTFETPVSTVTRQRHRRSASIGSLEIIRWAGEAQAEARRAGRHSGAGWILEDVV